MSPVMNLQCRPLLDSNRQRINTFPETRLPCWSPKIWRAKTGKAHCRKCVIAVGIRSLGLPYLAHFQDWIFQHFNRLSSAGKHEHRVVGRGCLPPRCQIPASQCALNPNTQTSSPRFSSRDDRSG